MPLVESAVEPISGNRYRPRIDRTQVSNDHIVHEYSVAFRAIVRHRECHRCSQCEHNGDQQPCPLAHAASVTAVETLCSCSGDIRGRWPRRPLLSLRQIKWPPSQEGSPGLAALREDASVTSRCNPDFG